MGYEEEQIVERIDVSIDRKVLTATLIIGFFSFMVAGFFIFYLSCCVITYGLSIIFGSTLGFLGIYFILISKPLFQVYLQSCSEEKESELEFQSTMKIK